MADNSSYKLMPLTKGRYAKVSPEDYEWLSQWKWTYNPSNGYAYRTYKRNGRSKNVFMHRAVNGTPDGMETDHINHDGLDNRRSNLRSVTRGVNSQNRRIRPGRYLGVRKACNSAMWLAAIDANGQRYSVSRRTPAEAARAYDAMALHFFGPEAQTNFHDVPPASPGQLRATYGLKPYAKRGRNPYRGVSFYKPTGRWRAEIQANGVRHSLGYFSTAKEAAHAYDDAVCRLRGPNHPVNFPDRRRLR